MLTLSELLGLSLELLDFTLGDASKLEDEATGGGRLAGIDVPADNDGEMSLAFGHDESAANSRRTAKRRERGIGGRRGWGRAVR